MKMIPVISVVGYSNSGKTTLVVKIIQELKNRGFKVAAIKHHHQDVEIDKPGKDTWRHAQAGADTVVLASPSKVAFFENTPKGMSLDEIISKISGVDIIITEGFKHEKKPKIEVFRSSVHEQLITPREELLAVASDIEFEGVPCFDLDEPKALVDFLIERYLTV
jgi:molybdopterin-guanine dinucleotide biosynthesis protein MobB